MSVRAVLAVLVAVAGCGDDTAGAGDGAPGDGTGGADVRGGASGGADSAVAECSRDAQCNDGLFCNGAESCDAGRCVAGETRSCDDGVACTADRCDEGGARCVHVAPDADADGHGDASCLGQGGAPLGTDCDDADAQRFPGNAEVCDADGHDEDCDLTTFGIVDADGDGAQDASCCNLNSEGTPLCGNDCNDAEAGIGPTSPEVCNDVDDDCDGSVDEGLPLTAWSPDCDLDGVGAMGEAIILDCARPLDTATCDLLTGSWVDVRGDCDEYDEARNPNVIEVCNRVDDDCDGAVDEGLPLTAWSPDCDNDGFGDASFSPVLSCAAPLQTASCGDVDGRWVDLHGDCDETDGGRNPGAPEVCNFKDDDCDDVVDDITAGAVICYAGESRSCTNVCGAPGTETCSASCLGFDSCLADELCNGCDDDGDGAADDGFQCALGASDDCVTDCGTPGRRTCADGCTWGSCVAPEECNYCDDDGDGSLLDERAGASNFTLDGELKCHQGVIAVGTAGCGGPIGGDPQRFYGTVIDGSEVPQAGALWFDTGVYTGWGPVRLEARVQSRVLGGGNPLGGFSVVLANRDTSALGASTAGVDGIWVDWYWASELYFGPGADAPPNAGDGFRYRANGAPRGDNDASVGISTGPDLDGAGDGWVEQTVIIDYTPDDPSTFANEEVVVITAGNTTQTYEVDERYWTTDPDRDLDLHVPLAVGIVANTRTQHYQVGPPQGITVGTEVEVRVHLSTLDGLMEPQGPTITYESNYARYDHCPGW